MEGKKCRFLKSLSLTGMAVILAAQCISGTALAKGSHTTFDPPDSTATYPLGINRSSAVTGYHLEGSDVEHGFVRASDGTITSFDPAGSVDTYPAGINREGTIAGYYYDGTTIHGFVRASDGEITASRPSGRALDTGVGNQQPRSNRGQLFGGGTVRPIVPSYGLPRAGSPPSRFPDRPTRPVLVSMTPDLLLVNTRTRKE